MELDGSRMHGKVLRAEPPPQRAFDKEGLGVFKAEDSLVWEFSLGV